MTTKSDDITIEKWGAMSKNIRVLNEDHEKKRIILEGQIEEGEGDEKTTTSGILILDKASFEFDEVLSLMKNGEQQFKVDFVNDIYRQYKVAARSVCNTVNITFIYPATPLHIKKFSKKEFRLVTETCHRYETIVRPYLEKQQFDLQWVYNILDGTSERERVLLDTDDFLLAPNPTWDGKALDSLHILAIVKPHNIRAFFHYPPTYYHLHVHFAALPNRTCGAEVERGRLLQDVIDHLQLKSDYYQTKTLYYKLAVTDPLYKLFEDDDQR